jgi:hypothetical protein
VNIERIRRRLSGGFRPFYIRTSDGHEFPVPHPEFVLIGRQSLAVLDSDHEVSSLDPLHIVALKDLPSKKNGRSGKP